jgi:signal transduction histidine kinase
VSQGGLTRLTALLTALVAVGLVVADAATSTTSRALLAGAALLLGLVALAARIQLAIDRRRERRLIRMAVRRAQAAAGVDRRRTASGTLLVLAGFAAALLAVQAMTGIAFWALLLLAAGGLVLWSQVAAPEPDPDQPATGWQRLVGRRGSADPDTDRMLLGGGIALVLLGALVTLSSLGALTASRTGVLQTIVAILAILVVVAPFWRRMSRRAASERSERIRSDERAEVAAHLHDSVLQTLALIQRRSDDPREVTSLARRQERELRLWLSGRSERPDDELMAALRAAAAAVEVEHAVEVEIVTSGERPLDDRTVAIVAAAREAMANAARHAFPDGVPATPGSRTIQVFAEADEDRVEVFVRDRGRGFDPADVPGDRRGVSESIVGRLRRAGGRATIHSAPGEGTEVELQLEDRS